MHPYKQHFIRLAIYNRWAFEQLIKTLNEHINDEIYRTDSGLFFRSIHGTLVHLLLASKLWYARLAKPPSKTLHDDQHPFEINSYWSRSANEWETAFADRANLSREILQHCDQWIVYVNGLDPEGLMKEETFQYFDTEGNPCERNRAEALDHVFNHNTHHRGQITAVMTRYGGQRASPVLDLSAMPRAEYDRPSF